MAKTNKLFSTNNENAMRGSMVSKVRVNREYLISRETADELNTYRTFSPFPTFNDLFAPEYDETGKEITDQDKSAGSGTLGVRSIFNKAGAVIIAERGVTDVNTEKIISECASGWRISNNVPLMDNKKTRQAIKTYSGCTIKELVKASQKGLLGRETYSYSDFMYCKYLGRISNNYMITLRRFPYPVDDYISSFGIGDDRSNKEYTTKNVEGLGCLVTWMGTPGNDMANILKYSVVMPFKEQKASFQNIEGQNDADSGGGIFNQIAAGFDKTYRKQYMEGKAGTQLNNLYNQYAPKALQAGAPPYPASQYNNWRDNYSKIHGPIDVVKTIYMRSDEGLDFQQNISITFDYELRSYNGINGRQAMLDLISNILNVTYNTGTFWGGGYRGGGAHQNNIFTNMEIFKSKTAERGLAGLVDAVIEDGSNLYKNAVDSINKNGGIVNTICKIANGISGMLLAGLLNKFGRPNKTMAAALLSPAPVGFWHLTIGNPHHPIMSLGNMILRNTTITHYGPLGIDDFPTGLKVTCELTRGKVRDIRDIEKIYMHGNDRIYSSMGPKIFDMYKHSQEYREKNGKVNGTASYSGGNPNTDANETQNENLKNNLDSVLKKYFGHSDQDSIKIAAMEQENGSVGKKKEGTAGGNSSAKANK